MEFPEEFRCADGESTFCNQENLPPLPYPDLKVTLLKYLDSVKPHLKEDEVEHTRKIVEEFYSGVGKELDSKLRSQAVGRRNWLEKLWDDKAYFEPRYPIAPQINVTGPGPYMRDIYPPKEGTWIHRASMVIHGTVLIWQIIHRGEFKINRGGGRTLWCMEQYKKIFNACRIPGEKIDHLECHFKTAEEGHCPRHVVFQYKGRYFSFDVLTPDGDILTAPEIAFQIRNVIKLAEQLPPKASITALTVDERTTWYRNRKYLLELHEENEEFLNLIQSSLLFFTYDDSSPSNAHEVCKLGLSGNPNNSWVDKSICYIIFKNGTVASNLDHSPTEGIIYIWITHCIDIMLHECNGEWLGSNVIRDLALPRHLDFHIDQFLLDASKQAADAYLQVANNLNVINPKFEGFGKDWLKSVRISPDSFVQVALQLAYYRLHKRAGATYETASLRKYWHGRTETVRSCTSESLDFCKAMDDDNIPMAHKSRLFNAAVKKQTLLMMEAMEMKGCDRHLLALMCLARDEGIQTPEIFKDSAYTKSGGNGNFVLSTSFVGFNDPIGGCAPMTEDGYGCFYCIQQDSMRFFITTWESSRITSISKFYESLAKSLQDMRHIIRSVGHKL